MTQLLNKAFIESLSSAPTDLLYNGRMYWDSTLFQIGVYDLDNTRWNYYYGGLSISNTQVKGHVLGTDGARAHTWVPGQTAISSISASYTILDGDGYATILGTSGSSTFDFVDGDVNTGTNKITEAGHAMDNGTPVHLTTAGVLPAGLSNKTYFVVNSDTNDFELSLTLGGAAVDITAAAGGGTHTVNKGVSVVLPTAANNVGRKLLFKKVDAGTSKLVVHGEGSEAINTSNYYNLAEQGDSLQLVCNGTGWDVTNLQLYPMQRTVWTPSNYLGFGATLSSINVDYRRDNEYISVQGYFTTGTATADEAQLELPGSRSIIGPGDTVLVGKAGRDTSNVLDYSVLATDADTYFNFANWPTTGAKNPMVPTAGTSMVGNSERVSLYATARVAEWVLHN